MSKNEFKTTPRVFISATKEDLEPYRNTAKDAALSAGFFPVMMDYFAARSDNPPYAVCMEKVDSCDVLVVIVAHRYGWVPPEQLGKKKDRSITWLECERAHSRNPKAEVLAFLVDEKFEWHLDRKEAYRSTKAIEEGKATAKLFAEVKRNVAQLAKFKQWLSGIGIRGSFTNPDNLHGQVLAALQNWRERHSDSQSAAADPPPRQDPAKYLNWLRAETMYIDIRGLQVGAGKAYQFPIHELYIPLKTLKERENKDADKITPKQQHVPLEEALQHPKLVIVGIPGSGKSTFLKRISWELCRSDGPPGLNLVPGWPILIRIADLDEHMRNCRAGRHHGAPTTKESPAWLAHFLEQRSRENGWGLNSAFFEQKLKDNSTCVLLDGLDEAVNRADRESMARLLERATVQYPGCRFVVTTRPAGYEDRATLAGFHEVQIDDLEKDAIELFLKRWSQSLFPDSEGGAQRHFQQLLQAVGAREEIGRMARNPVMLTALAVVHWNEKRLPEQRAELYESILTWLSRSREQRPGRERALALLGHLALGMQSQPEGRLATVSLGRAAGLIAPHLRDVPEDERLDRARAFLDDEELDSGIVDIRGTELRFRHLTFQEFLAARTLAGFTDAARQARLRNGDKLYLPEWREVMLLLAGILLVKQGAEKVDGLFHDVLDWLGDDDASLADRARSAGLLGGMLRDLRPLGYQPADPRYRANLTAVLPIFEKGEAESIDLRVRLEAAEAIGQAGDPRLRPEVDNWVTIPAGSFLMGAQKEDSSKPNYDDEAYVEDESPVHEVRLDAYQIGRYPVTVAEYQRFMDAKSYQNEEWWKAGGFGSQTEPGQWEEQRLHPNRPVVNVTWYEAAAWCAWAGGRLPTEAEWERAARGLGARKYPWGNEGRDLRRANYGLYVGCPSPIGLFPRGMALEGTEGILDLAGNVWEWLVDWYAADYYGKSPEENPQGPKEGNSRVMRGGSWSFDSIYICAAKRGRDAPDVSDDYSGFRCVRAVLP